MWYPSLFLPFPVIISAQIDINATSPSHRGDQRMNNMKPIAEQTARQRCSLPPRKALSTPNDLTNLQIVDNRGWLNSRGGSFPLQISQFGILPPPARHRARHYNKNKETLKHKDNQLKTLNNKRNQHLKKAPSAPWSGPPRPPRRRRPARRRGLSRPARPRSPGFEPRT